MYFLILHAEPGITKQLNSKQRRSKDAEMIAEQLDSTKTFTQVGTMSKLRALEMKAGSNKEELAIERSEWQSKLERNRQ